jgi:hypothetical protein
MRLSLAGDGGPSKHTQLPSAKRSRRPAVFYCVPEIINRYVQKMQLESAELLEGWAKAGLHLVWKEKNVFRECGR